MAEVLNKCNDVSVVHDNLDPCKLHQSHAHRDNASQSGRWFHVQGASDCLHNLGTRLQCLECLPSHLHVRGAVTLYLASLAIASTTVVAHIAMAMMGDTRTDIDGPPPPPPPPLPLAPSGRRENASVALKVRNAPPKWACDPYPTIPSRKVITPPAGLYFFYGSLQDPDVLTDILDLQSPPVFQPATLVGHKVHMWGQYPALLPDPDALVSGLVFEVADEVHAAKLATYETNSYRVVPCIINFNSTDIVGDATRAEGFVFEFCGNARDLTDGAFDLTRWRRLNGRRYAQT